MKSGRFGVKAFTLAEFKSGYFLNSKIYTSKENGVVHRDLREKVVMAVFQPYMDKMY